MPKPPTLQVAIISLIGAVAAILGFIANILRNGWIPATLSAALILIVLILSIYQIRCVVLGNCTFTSWFNTFVATSLFGSIGLYYLLALTHNLPLPGLEEQPIARANPNVKYVTDTLKSRLHVDLYKYADQFKQGQTNGQVVSSSSASAAQ